MRRGRGLIAALVAALTSSCAMPPPAPGVQAPPVAASGAGATIELSSLPGWNAEDHAAAYRAFRETCRPGGALSQPCRSARATGDLSAGSARAFLEEAFRAQPLAGEGVLTGYFTPVYEARTARAGPFTAPVRGLPADLTMVDAGLIDPGRAGRPLAAKTQADGTIVPYPDRAEIEAQPAAAPLAWMRPEELFLLQVQGSGVLVLPDGRRMKAVYAGDNGRPFVGLANPMRARGLLPTADLSSEAIRSWLAAHRGAEADALMALNPRYVFFRMAPDDGAPPTGSAGVPLPDGRAVAVDPAFHPLGELLWIDGEEPLIPGAFPAYRRLVTALDTGGAIKGSVRADLYVGQGDAAGMEAGRIRHTLRLYRIVPR